MTLQVQLSSEKRMSPFAVAKTVACIILVALSLHNMYTLNGVNVNFAKSLRNLALSDAATTDEKIAADGTLQIIEEEISSVDKQQMIIAPPPTASVHLNIAEYTFPSPQERLQYYMGDWYNKLDWTPSESDCHHLNQVKDSLTISGQIAMYTTTGMKECMDNHVSSGIAKYCADAYTIINTTLPATNSSDKNWLVSFGDIVHDTTLPIISKARPSALSFHSKSIIWLLNKNSHYRELEEYHSNIVREGKEIPWSEKLSKIFWRGSSTGTRDHTRIEYLAQWINYNDNRTDIAFSNVVQMKSDFDRYYVKRQYFRKAKTISEMNRYKYLLSIEGNDVATGLKWMLYSNSVVFMSRPTVASWAMEDLLVPFVHYIPLANDYSNLLQMLQWAEEHDEACQEISKRATEFMEQLWISDQAKMDTEYLRMRLVTAYAEKFDGALSKCDLDGRSNSSIDESKLPHPTSVILTTSDSTPLVKFGRDISGRKKKKRTISGDDRNESKFPHPTPSISETSFSTASKTAYGSAIALETNRSGERPIFDATTWNHNTMGGLLPIDRPFLGKIYEQATSVFEWGLGESTRIAASVKVPRYSGIDSDSNYVADSRTYVVEHFALDHFRFYFADIGSTAGWGRPVKILQKNIYDYQFAALASESEAFDVYMVDGRYRVACVAAAFLHASQHGGVNTTVLMHDYDREGYHAVEKLAFVDGRSGGTLVALKRRPSTTDEDLLEFWTQHKNKID